jgi:hypothetical protein
MMKRRAATGLVCLLALATFVWAIVSTEWWKTRRHFASIAAEVASSPKLVLYEGLPHERADRESFLSALQTKPTIKIQEHFFYEHPLEAPPEAIASLRSLCAAADSFRPWRPGKLCMGFHPDFALQWTKGDSIVSFLICFGCLEMQIDSPRGRLMMDLNDHKSFLRILKPLRRERPVADYDGLLNPPPRTH